jgi:multidrug efflux pump
LIAVFLPISFIPGNLGRLFGEFGITIAAAIGCSALISLTLVPMMSSKIFANGIVRGRVAHASTSSFRWFVERYERSLRSALHAPTLIVGAGIASISIAVVLFRMMPSEYAPAEDRQRVCHSAAAPEGASLQYMERYRARSSRSRWSRVEKGNARLHALAHAATSAAATRSTSVRVVHVAVGLRRAQWSRRRRSRRGCARSCRISQASAPWLLRRRSRHSRLRLAGADRARRR